MLPGTGQIEIDTIAAEHSRFTAPLVLVHGLWCTGAVWRRLMGYLAHRGWNCHALHLPGRGTGAAPGAGLSDYLDALDRVIRSCETPPVIIGHDLGGFLALARDLGRRRAVVALAPLVPAGHGAPTVPGLSGLRPRLEMWLGRRCSPPHGRAAVAHFGQTPPCPAVAEPITVVRDLCDPQRRLALGPAVPGLVIAGDADAVTPGEASERLAHAAAAELRRIPGGGHALPWEAGWEERGSEIHRWLVQTLGEPLLALRPEEEGD